MAFGEMLKENTFRDEQVDNAQVEIREKFTSDGEQGRHESYSQAGKSREVLSNFIKKQLQSWLLCFRSSSQIFHFHNLHFVSADFNSFKFKWFYHHRGGK